MIFNYLNISWIFQFLVGHYYLEYTVKNKNLWDISLFSAVVSVHFRPYVKSSQYLLVERILVVLYLSLSPMSILLAPLDFLTKRQIRKKLCYILQASWSELPLKFKSFYIVIPSFGYTWCCIAQWWWAWRSWPWVSPWWCWAWPSRSAAVRTEHDRCPDRWRRTGPWGQIYPCSIPNRPLRRSNANWLETGMPCNPFWGPGKIFDRPELSALRFAADVRSRNWFTFNGIRHKVSLIRDYLRVQRFIQEKSYYISKVSWFWTLLFRDIYCKVTSSLRSCFSCLLNLSPSAFTSVRPYIHSAYSSPNQATQNWASQPRSQL